MVPVIASRTFNSVHIIIIIIEIVPPQYEQQVPVSSSCTSLVWDEIFSFPVVFNFDLFFFYLLKGTCCFIFSTSSFIFLRAFFLNFFFSLVFFFRFSPFDKFVLSNTSSTKHFPSFSFKWFLGNCWKPKYLCSVFWGWWKAMWNMDWLFRLA